MTTRNIILILTALAFSAVGWALSPTAATAQPTPGTLEDVFISLQAEGTQFTIEFVDAVPRIGRSVNVGPTDPIELSLIGPEALCLRQPATSNTQVTCVPYSNVTAVMYSE